MVLWFVELASLSLAQYGHEGAAWRMLESNGSLLESLMRRRGVVESLMGERPHWRALLAALVLESLSQSTEEATSDLASNGSHTKHAHALQYHLRELCSLPRSRMRLETKPQTDCQEQ